MKGRKENEEKKLRKIEVKIENQPIYIKKYYYTLDNKSYTTKDTYINYVLSFIEFVKNDLHLDTSNVSCFNNIKKSDIDYYLSGLNGKTSIKRCRLYGIKTFFEFLEDDEYISNNPCLKVAVPKEKEEHVITSLTKKEIAVVKQNILNGSGSYYAKSIQRKWKKRDMAIMMLGLSLGFRVTSLTEINLEDIDFKSQKIAIVEKGNKMRTVMFSNELKKVLLDWVEDRRNILGKDVDSINALFISNRHTRISANGIEKLVAKYTQNIDKHITPHKLRSTCATNVYNKTGDIYLTADILGHNNISTTRRYAQISEERKKKAATVMDDILF